jgi:UDP-N-acetylmuramoyl-tripeptide--D-alanyl-D-alanine ligase
MRLRASEIAAAVGGTLHGRDTEVDGAGIDSRRLRRGELFVPVVGRRDGHDYIPDALAAGAPAYLTARPPRGETAVTTDDTVSALNTLARWARRRLPDRVVAVTGSVGKTTTKDLLAAALARRFLVGASPRSFNNELGVPLSLLGVPSGAEMVVLEMGTGGAGEIARHCELARPSAGIVTRVAPAHLETLGDLAGVARAKAELVETLPVSGLAVLNADDPWVAAMRSRTPAAVLSFGRAARAEVVATGVTVGDDLRPCFRLRSPWGAADVRLTARGEHQVGNALAATAMALAWGIPLDEVTAALELAPLSPGRMQLLRTPSGAMLLDDAYNASPASVAGALRSLARLPARRRVAVLGAMAELGRCSDGYHRTVAALAAGLGIRLIQVGPSPYGAERVDSAEGAVAALGAFGDGDAILVKGSRVTGVDQVARALLSVRKPSTRTSMEPILPAACRGGGTQDRRGCGS